MKRLSQKILIFKYLKRCETKSKYDIFKYFDGRNSKAVIFNELHIELNDDNIKFYEKFGRISPETVGRRLRELREDTEIAETSGLDIEMMKVYSVDDETYSIYDPKRPPVQDDFLKDK